MEEALDNSQATQQKVLNQQDTAATTAPDGSFTGGEQLQHRGLGYTGDAAP